MTASVLPLHEFLLHIEAVRNTSFPWEVLRAASSWYGIHLEKRYLYVLYHNRVVRNIEDVALRGLYHPAVVRNHLDLFPEAPYHESMVRNTEKRDLCVPYRTIGGSPSME